MKGVSVIIAVKGMGTVIGSSFTAWTLGMIGRDEYSTCMRTLGELHGVAGAIGIMPPILFERVGRIPRWLIRSMYLARNIHRLRPGQTTVSRGNVPNLA